MKNKAINLGGDNTERLFLKDLKFELDSGERVVVKKTSIPNMDMADLVARHRGRYALLGLYSRPEYQVLDFPCGSGYASEILKEFDVVYHGMEVDPLAVAYASRVYGRKHASFEVGDLQKPVLPNDFFDTIGCIEGIEHIEMPFQDPLIAALKKALKKGGTLIVSSPESPAGVSGPSTSNKWHKWEMTGGDFLALLRKHFDMVEFITQKAVLSTGVPSVCYYGVCHK